MSKVIESMDGITAEHYYKEIVLSKCPSYRFKTIRYLFELAQILSNNNGIFREIYQLLETVIRFRKQTSLGIVSEIKRLDLSYIQAKKILKTMETQLMHSKNYFDMLNQWKDKSKKQYEQLLLFKATLNYCKKVIRSRLQALKLKKDPIYRAYSKLKIKW